MSWRREVRRAVGGSLNVLGARVMNARSRAAPLEPLSIEDYRALAVPVPLDTVRLLAGRSNVERARLTEAALQARGAAVTRWPFRSVEGRGVNLFADVGDGARVLVLAAHHDAVPGSPGANDNAAGIGILLALWDRLIARPLRRLRVRLAFFAAEERAMLGARVYTRRTSLEGIVGAVSLELCGLGDSLVLWDVTPEVETSPLVRAWMAGVESLGYRRDEDHHLAPKVPLFGSDHRPFAERGVPGVGLTVVPRAAAERLRAFIYGGVRGKLIPPRRRPPPFDTYHTVRDRPETLDPDAMNRATAALDALCRALDHGGAAAR